jgi:hypothetical protein
MAGAICERSFSNGGREKLAPPAPDRALRQLPQWPADALNLP